MNLVQELLKNIPRTHKSKTKIAKEYLIRGFFNENKTYETSSFGKYII